ncbi:MAG: sensor histidine kinase [Micrococcaceae bacterium]
MNISSHLGQSLDTGSNPKEEEQYVLRLIVEDWQIIADLSFADLILWRKSDSRGYVSAAHCRPATTAALYNQDIVGDQIPKEYKPYADKAWNEVKSVKIPGQVKGRKFNAYVEVFPMVFNGKVVALLSRHTGDYLFEEPVRIEQVHVNFANALLYMNSLGYYFQLVDNVWNKRGVPRAGDGLLSIDVDGYITFASPNAVSAFRRLGYEETLDGAQLQEVVKAVMPERQIIEDNFHEAITGRRNTITELTTPKASITLRSIPLFDEYCRYGALLFCKDNTELRRREQQLESKDATIREIQHRVKNNLQMVVALLRMQARRMPVPEAQSALKQAMHRINSIALIHESLSHNLNDVVNFDKIIDANFLLAIELASPGQKIYTKSVGKFGLIPAEAATPLSLIINEIVSNAVEHGFKGAKEGKVILETKRKPLEDGRSEMTVRIIDNGRGMKDGKLKEGLGTEIVKTLVKFELQGTIDWNTNAEGGTTVEIKFELPAV